jgi:hypothetical protein
MCSPCSQTWMQQQPAAAALTDGFVPSGGAPRKRSSSGELDPPAKRPSGDAAPRANGQVRLPGPAGLRCCPLFLVHIVNGALGVITIWCTSVHGLPALDMLRCHMMRLPCRSLLPLDVACSGSCVLREAQAAGCRCARSAGRATRRPGAGPGGSCCAMRAGCGGTGPWPAATAREPAPAPRPPPKAAPSRPEVGGRAPTPEHRRRC